jgi:hypothetical protein
MDLLCFFFSLAHCTVLAFFLWRSIYTQRKKGKKKERIKRRKERKERNNGD